MIVKLIVKKRETKDGKKFNSFSTNKSGKWYAVKFVRDCPPPQVITVDGNVRRAWIELSAVHTFNVRANATGNGMTIFIENYASVSDDVIARCVEAEKKEIATYREAQEKARRDFLVPENEQDLPF